MGFDHLSGLKDGRAHHTMNETGSSLCRRYVCLPVFVDLACLGLRHSSLYQSAVLIAIMLDILGRDTSLPAFVHIYSKGIRMYFADSICTLSIVSCKTHIFYARLHAGDCCECLIYLSSPESVAVLPVLYCTLVVAAEYVAMRNYETSFPYMVVLN